MGNDVKSRNGWVLKGELVVLACIFGIWILLNGAAGIGTLKASVLEQVVRMNPEDPDAHYDLGEAYWRLSKYGDAAESYEEVIRIAPGHFDARYSLALAYARLGRREEALAVCKEAVRVDPVNAAAYFGLGSEAAFIARNRAAGTARHDGSHLAATPVDWTEALPGPSEKSQAQNDFLQMEVLKRATASEGSAEAYSRLGRACGEAGLYEQAAEAFEQTIRMDPNNATAYLSLGVSCDRLGRYEAAVDAYKQAIRLRPDDALMYRNLGIAYAHLDRHAEAMDAYREAVRVKPDYAEAHFLLGLNHLMRCDTTSAAHEHEILKTLNPYLAGKLLDLISG
jgi:tetratricopeptide (TPR) repeat protein